jgi:hypothetical protein
MGRGPRWFVKFRRRLVDHDDVNEAATMDILSVLHVMLNWVKEVGVRLSISHCRQESRIQT